MKNNNLGLGASVNHEVSRTKFGMKLPWKVLDSEVLLSVLKYFLETGLPIFWWQGFHEV